ncbi:alpha-L-rhamnosidase C-terminal domain-containing protein [Streptomyces sp. NPDC000987]|uniref:alpha-L-rhamnosidase C-terminal domain-containing protein n=1 Tax=Streptomyces sp. NPDC000987 TaxID=3154374 RepID=UPI003319911D
MGVKGSQVQILSSRRCGGPAQAKACGALFAFPAHRLTSASARRDCPHGTVRRAWERRGDSFAPTVEVPPGTGAEVRLPGGTRARRGPRRPPLRRPPGRARSGPNPAVRGRRP